MQPIACNHYIILHIEEYFQFFLINKLFRRDPQNSHSFYSLIFLFRRVLVFFITKDNEIYKLYQKKDIKGLKLNELLLKQ